MPPVLVAMSWYTIGLVAANEAKFAKANGLVTLALKLESCAASRTVLLL